MQPRPQKYMLRPQRRVPPGLAASWRAAAASQRVKLRFQNEGV